MLSVPKRGTSKKRCGKMLPYAAVTQRSGASSASRARKSACHGATGASLDSVVVSKLNKQNSAQSGCIQLTCKLHCRHRPALSTLHCTDVQVEHVAPHWL